MPFKNENFSDLKLSKVRDYAQGWVKDYPCIENISLYRAGYEFKSIPENENDVKYIIVVKAPPNPVSRNKNKDGSYNFSLEYKDIKSGVEIKELPTQKISTTSFPKLPRYPNHIVSDITTFECHDATLEIKAMNVIDNLSDEAIQRYPELEDILGYYEWVEQASYKKCIPDFYAIKDASLYEQRINNWSWFTINPEDDISEYNEKANEFIKENEKEILYPCPNDQTSKSVENLNSEETQILICNNDNKTSHVDGPETGHQAHITIPVPAGTTWAQIHFRIVNPTRIEIITPGGMCPYSPAQLGLLRKKRLHDLFETFAETDYLQEHKQDIYDLNQHLKKIFPSIKENPIIKAKIPKDKLKVLKGYTPTEDKLIDPKGYTPSFHILIA